MIRVTARHVEDPDGVLIGDFPPSEIRPLIELLGTTDIYMGDREDVGLNDPPAQFIQAGGTGAPRLCMEILLDGGA